MNKHNLYIIVPVYFSIHDAQQKVYASHNNRQIFKKNQFTTKARVSLFCYNFIEYICNMPRGPPSPLYNGHRVFPGGKAVGTWR